MHLRQNIINYGQRTVFLVNITDFHTLFGKLLTKYSSFFIIIKNETKKIQFERK